VIANKAFWRISDYWIAKFFSIPLIILGNFFISRYFTSGDQEFYRLVYHGLGDEALIEGFLYYTLRIQSKEILHYLVSWIGSHIGLDKDLYFALFSGLLAYIFLTYCEKQKTTVWIALLIVFTNFYFFVLYFAAERLKIAFIFFFLSILMLKEVKVFAFFGLLSFFSHVQMAILYIAMAFVKLVEPILIGRISKVSLLIAALISAPIYYLGDHIFIKFLFYSEAASEKGADEILRLLIFFCLSFMYSSDRRQVVLIFIPLAVSVMLIGGDRINMFGYFIFLFYGLRYRGGVNAGILLTSAYFAFASYQFIVNIFIRSNGFDFG
jgi:hypothetical protein